MTILGSADAIEFDAHGSTFDSYVASRNSAQLCAWKLTVAPASHGVAHRPSRDEILLVLDGTLHITIDGTPSSVEPGNVVLVRAGAEVIVDGGPQGAHVWVTTTPGLTATLADGTRLTPPWAQ
ncbi:MAG: cupin domain-containing protein [Rhodococcus sp. (in: high G+C Gram-positive bacteria)]|uniref:cupin domain-containing protein n=1 Tax=Rhodococcus sp. TaxID=1831 RepID=UPI003BB549A9